MHLVTHWASTVEKSLKAIPLHQNFRLFLTTEQHTSFPTILLQQSLNITYESPPGVKQNLIRTYESWDNEYISNGGVTRAQMLFILAWFHAITQERRTYIPQGWSKFYEFSFADLRSGADIIDSICRLCNKQKKDFIDPNSVPWTTVWGLFKFAIYGGRVDNEHDVRVLVTYLRRFFHRDILPPGVSTPPARKLAPTIELPSSSRKEDYVQLIHRLSDTDAPQLFSLPDNIESTVQQTASAAVVSSLRRLAAVSSLSSKFDREQWRTQLSPILQLWDRLVNSSPEHRQQLLNRPLRLSKNEIDYSPTDMFAVLENQKVHRMITILDHSLSALNSVVNSSGLLTSDVRDDGLSLISAKVPSRWQKLWILGPEDPAIFIREIVRRKVALLQWLDKAEKSSLLTQPIRLSQIFSARTFLNALRQQTSRLAKVPVDSLKLTCSFSEQILPKSAILKVQIEGLLL